MIDFTITVGNIIEIATIASGGVYAVLTVKNSVTNFGRDLVRMEADFFDMKVEIKKVGDVLIKMAVTDTRLVNVEQDVRELKHGIGFIKNEVEGEYDRKGKIR